MKIRSITCFLDPCWPLDLEVLHRAGKVIAAAVPAFETAGYEVQTCRLATPSFARMLGAAEAGQVVEFAIALERAAQAGEEGAQGQRLQGAGSQASRPV